MIGDAPGNRSTIGLRPDVLGWVEFGRVRREVMDVEPAVGREEVANLAPPVDGAAIPEQVHGAAEVAEQMLQEGADVEAREVARATTQIEGQPAPLW